MVTVSDNRWDTAAIRRAIRLLGAHSPRIDDTQSTARALRLVHDIAQRRGAPAEIFQLPGMMPLILVGRGPIVLITHLDDPNPLAQVEDIGPPSISGDTVTVPGIMRKAGVLAALGAVLGSEDVAAQVTLVVESDRHSGSRSFDSWLGTAERSFSAAICEVADLPVPAPAIYQAATGLVTVRISLRGDAGNVERVYGGVQSDLGYQLVSTLSALKSGDGEVLVPGFYDDVITPDVDGLSSLQGIAASVGAWLNRGQPPTGDRLSASHLTLGAFLAPSIVVRELHVDVSGPYLATWASAVIEARVMPGQDANAIARSISDFVRERLPGAATDPMLVRPSATAAVFDSLDLKTVAPVIPVAAGNSPAGLLAGIGIPTLGFSTVGRDPASRIETVTVSSIADRSAFIADLVRGIAGAVGGARSQ